MQKFKVKVVLPLNNQI